METREIDLAKDVADVLQRKRQIGDERRRLINLNVTPRARIANRSLDAQCNHITLEISAQIRTRLLETTTCASTRAITITRHSNHRHI